MPSTDQLWIIGQGGPGARCALNLATFFNRKPNVQILATDNGEHSATVQFLSMESGPAPGTLEVRFQLNPDGSAAFPTMPGLPGTGTADLTVDSNGDVAPQTSSARFKDKIRPLKDEFHKILSLEPKVFASKETGDESIGYIAEELNDNELNHLVSLDEDGKPLSVHYKLLPVYLLEIIKQQQSMITELKQGLADLQSTVR